MNGFTLELASASAQRRYEQVLSFVGADASGQFGVLPGHTPLATVLMPGLARCRLAEPASATDPWVYLALPGGVLRFAHNRMSIATRFFAVGDQPDQLSAALARDMKQDAEQTTHLRRNLQQLEQTLMQRLWRLEPR